MNKEIESITDSRQKVTVTFTAEEVVKEEKKTLGTFTRSARLPGFRPGKAPEAIIRKKYAKDISAELERAMSQKAFEAVREVEGGELFQVLDLEVESVDVANGATLVIEMDIVPSFDLPSYSEFSYEEEDTQPTDEEVEKTIENIRQQRADFKVVETEASEGDYVKLSYEGKIGEESVAELVSDNAVYGTQSNAWEQAGSEDARIKEIATAVIGMKAGDKKDVTVAYADDFLLKL